MSIYIPSNGSQVTLDYVNGTFVSKNSFFSSLATKLNTTGGTLSGQTNFNSNAYFNNGITATNLSTFNSLTVNAGTTLFGTVSVGTGYNNCNLIVRGGANSDATIYASKQIQMNYDAPNGGISHFIRSRHSGAMTPLDNSGNAIDFFIYNSGTNLNSSTFPGKGNKLSATITGAGVGVGVTYPSYSLDVLGNARFSSGIIGVINGIDGQSGTIGEYRESQYLTLSIGANTSYNDAAFFSLPAGDWLITHQCNAYPLTNNLDSNIIAITTTSGNNGTGVTLGISAVSGFSQGSGRQIATFIQIRVNITSTTTYYAKYYAGSNSWSINGKLFAIRIR